MLHVGGMKVNLISKSQLYDEDLMGYFDKRRCYVVKEDEEYNIMRTRSADNFYQMNAVTNSFSMIANVLAVEL